MAQKSTIYKADCHVADIDRNYYQPHNLTIALHPSETEERMMVRLLAFLLNAHDRLQFCKGLCTDDEPDLWQLSLTDAVELWIDVGMPDENRIRKACSRADKVVIYSYGGRNKVWWQQIQHKLERFANLTVINLPKSATEQLIQLVKRTMQLHIRVQDEQILLGDNQQTVHIVPEIWLNS
jgi:uncharacterized protein YaeQ